MSAETPRKASQCVHASKPLNYLWPLCSLPAARSSLLPAYSSINSTSQFIFWIRVSNVRYSPASLSTCFCIFRTSITLTYLISLRVYRSCAVLAFVATSEYSFRRLSAMSRNAIASVSVCLSSNMVCVLVLLTHRMSQSIRSRMPLAETRSSSGSSTGWSPSCTRTTRRSRCISCSYRRCASARSANASASSMRSRDCSGCLFITCVSSHMRTESYYDSRYMSVENESDGRVQLCFASCSGLS